MTKKCPGCLRGFANLLDYPLVLLEKAEIVKPENVPDIVSEVGNDSWEWGRTNNPPGAVIDYFAANHDKDFFLHGEFIFKRPEAQILSRTSDEWSREKILKYGLHDHPYLKYSKCRNISGIIKTLINSDEFQKYADRLLFMTGKIVSAENLTPKWKPATEMDTDKDVKKHDNAKYMFCLPECEEKYLLEFREADGSKGHSSCVLNVSVPHFDNTIGIYYKSLIKIGGITYKGMVFGRHARNSKPDRTSYAIE